MFGGSAEGLGDECAGKVELVSTVKFTRPKRGFLMPREGLHRSVRTATMGIVKRCTEAFAVVTIPMVVVTLGVPRLYPETFHRRAIMTEGNGCPVGIPVGQSFTTLPSPPRRIFASEQIWPLSPET